ELVNNQAAIEVVIERFYTANEQSILKQADGASKYEVFFKLFTRKEALAKAVGLGLSLPLRQLDVAASPVVLTNERSISQWRLIEFVPAEDYVACVALQAEQLDSQYSLSFYDADVLL